MKEASSRLTEGNVIGSKKPFLPPMPFIFFHRGGMVAAEATAAGGMVEGGGGCRG
jgi:hypothetical protein